MAGETQRDLLNKALERLGELDAEREALNNLIETYKKFSSVLQSIRKPAEEQPDLYRGTSARAEQRAHIDDTLAAARRIITESKRPMKRGEIVAKLEQQGFQLPGTNKNKVFGTNLWRSGKFTAVEGKGYWPNDIELPSGS